MFHALEKHRDLLWIEAQVHWNHIVSCPFLIFSRALTKILRRPFTSLAYCQTKLKGSTFIILAGTGRCNLSSHSVSCPAFLVLPRFTFLQLSVFRSIKFLCKRMSSLPTKLHNLHAYMGDTDSKSVRNEGEWEYPFFH